MTFLEIAQELALARKDWATDFLLYRTMHAKSDGQAKAMADDQNIMRLTMAEAKYELAKWRLSHAADEPAAPSPDHEPTEATADEEGTVPDFCE